MCCKEGLFTTLLVWSCGGLCVETGASLLMGCTGGSGGGNGSGATHGCGRRSESEADAVASSTVSGPGRLVSHPLSAAWGRYLPHHSSDDSTTCAKYWMLGYSVAQRRTLPELWRAEVAREHGHCSLRIPHQNHGWQQLVFATPFLCKLLRPEQRCIDR